MSTSNVFAIALVYYYNFVRSKLASSTCANDLLRVKKKYAGKPEQLLPDLVKKYIFPAVESVKLHEVSRIVGLYEVPEGYTALIPELRSVIVKTSGYDKRLDVINAEFDADYCLLEAKRLICSDPQAEALDNMSKAYKLLPKTSYEYVSKVHKSDHIPMVPFQKKDPSKGSNEKEDNRSFYDQIVDYSCPVTHYRNDLGVQMSIPAPISLLKQFIVEKQRIRVVLRRRSGLRGSIDGFIRCFDRYYNLLLYDCDEEYLLNKQRSRSMIKGKFVNQYQVLHRHLVQVMVRGDNIVMVYRKP